MESNPYASPNPEQDLPPHSFRLLLRLAAICFWLVSLFLVLGIMTTWNRPEIVARRSEGPLLFAVVWMVGFILPALAFAILGIGSWLRRRTLVSIGLAFFVPLLLFISY